MDFFIQRLVIALSLLALVPTASCRLGESLNDFTSGASGTGGDGKSDASAGMDGSDAAHLEAGEDALESCLQPNKVCQRCEFGEDCSPPPALGGKCVESDDPDYGCSSDTCAPCAAVSNATSKCLNHKCALQDCVDGFWDCDGNPETGCETNIWSLDDCGKEESACGQICAPAHATAACNKGVCDIVECQPQWADCNDDARDGCETNLRTIENCGQCGQKCELANGTPTCATGECKLDLCTSGWASCNGDCDTSITTTSNCGACGVQCSGPHVSEWACNEIQGNRTCQVVTCDAGWANCDGDHTNGCETNLNSSIEHCGSCHKPCSEQNTNARACVEGVCNPTCSSGWANCDGNKPGATDNGCETNIRTVQHCGGCGLSCSRTNATATCETGICTIAQCNSGYQNCDNLDSTGCETHIQTSTNHCGGCTRPCSSHHISAKCTGGQCTGTCTPGWADCDNNKQSNGCETDTTSDVNHCGGCNILCSSSHMNQTTCSAGVCNGTCAAGWGDCNNDKLSDGCETNLTNVKHCGTCGNDCTKQQLPGGHEAWCNNGTCASRCKATWEECGTNCCHPESVCDHEMMMCLLPLD